MAWISMSVACPCAPPRVLVHVNGGVRQGIAMAFGACGKQDGTKGSGDTHGDGADHVGDHLHGVRRWPDRHKSARQAS